MSVTVVTGYSAAGEGVETTFADAHAISVNDGHLFVSKWVNSEWKTLGLFAPGKWMDASVDDAAQRPHG